MSTPSGPVAQAAPDAVVLVATLLSHQPGVDAAHSGTAGASAGTQAATTSSGNGVGAVGSAALPNGQQDSAGTGSEPAASEQRQQQQPQQQRPDTDAGVLVGTVEMSFTDTTRTRFLTLNPPTVGKHARHHDSCDFVIMANWMSYHCNAWPVPVRQVTQSNLLLQRRLSQP
jgi:hypothetical protein